MQVLSVRGRGSSSPVPATDLGKAPGRPAPDTKQTGRGERVRRPRQPTEPDRAEAARSRSAAAVLCEVGDSRDSSPRAKPHRRTAASPCTQPPARTQPAVLLEAQARPSSESAQLLPCRARPCQAPSRATKQPEASERAEGTHQQGPCPLGPGGRGGTRLGEACGLLLCPRPRVPSGTGCQGGDGADRRPRPPL